MFNKKKLKREDFLFQNGWFEDKIKKPTQLQMQQFQISDCQQCNIFLFDAAACVYVDECKYCRIFIGACQSSVFIRDCQFITVICTTQQFRVRDSFSCYFSIFCESQPIIQSSYDINISCFPSFAYEGLDKQMKEAKTNPWNNNWFDVYDFTPKKFNKINFKLTTIPKQIWSPFLDKLQEKLREINLEQQVTLIPRVSGKKQQNIKDICVLVVYPVVDSRICKNFEVIQSRVHRIDFQQQVGLKLKINSEQARASVLFIKILKRYTSAWEGAIKQIVKKIVSMEELQLYENTVFAPFKDEH